MTFPPCARARVVGHYIEDILAQNSLHLVQNSSAEFTAQCLYSSWARPHRSTGVLSWHSTARGTHGSLVSSFSISYYRTLLVPQSLAALWKIVVGRVSSIGIATLYGLEFRGSNPGGGEIFRTPAHRPGGPPSLLYKEHRVIPRG